jgi:type VI secretion system secreted protein Hcp
MRRIKEKKWWMAGVMAAALGTLLVSSVNSGNLEPASPPSPTMHTLDEIYGVASTMDKLVGPLAGAKVRTAAYMQMANGAVQGEATEPSHLNWIEILWSSHKLEQPLSSGGASGARTGTKVTFSEFHVIKEIDRSSPTLYLDCASNTQIDPLVIEYTKMAGGSKVYLKITMRKVTIGSVAPVMTYRTNGEYTHLEEVTFRFEEIQWIYNQYNEAGDLLNTVTTKWKVRANKAD